MNAHSRCLGFVLLGALATRALPAAAADTDTDSAPEPPAESAPAPNGPKLVIVADIETSATRNSELRAVLYEVARSHGYDAAGKLDVEGVASRESLMKAGSITTDPGELRSLRTALKVSALVRVSKDSEENGKIQARLSVVTKAGVQGRVVATSASGAPDALRAALDELLPHLEPESSTGTSLVPHAAESPSSAGAIVAGEAKPDTTGTAKSAREAWERRGGLRPTYGALALITATQIRQMPFDSPGPGGKGTRHGEATATGVGGGVGVRVGLTYLPIPDPNLSTGGFVAFRFGVGLDMDVLDLRAPSHYAYSSGNPTVSYAARALWVANLPIDVGFAIAAGRFHGTSSWKGALIGVAYAPALQFSMNLNDTSGQFRFNPAGAQGTIDITKMDTSQGEDSEMQIRLLLWGVAPLDTAHPGLVSMGLGAIWY